MDWLIDQEDVYTPVEVKWTENPASQDIRHLQIFLSEYPSAKAGYLVCQAPRKIKLDSHIFALPWQFVNELI